MTAILPSKFFKSKYRKLSKQSLTIIQNSLNSQFQLHKKSDKLIVIQILLDSLVEEAVVRGP